MGDVHAVFRVGEKLSGGGGEGGGVADFDRPAGTQEGLAEGCEIFHVRSEKHGAPGEDCLDGILSACAAEAFADEDDVRAGIPVAEFTGGIEEKNVGCRAFGWCGAAGDAEIGFGQLGENLSGALDMARGDEEAGRPRRAAVQTKFGQISLSVRMMARGRTVSRACRTMGGRSTGV